MDQLDWRNKKVAILWERQGPWMNASPENVALGHPAQDTSSRFGWMEVRLTGGSHQTERGPMSEVRITIKSAARVIR